MYTMPLIELVPPSTLPRGWYIVRPFELRLGLAFEHPVDLRVREQPRIADRNMDPPVTVLIAGFEQQHAVLAAFAEPGGDAAAGRAGAGHDVVEGAGVDCRAVRFAVHDEIPKPVRRSASTWSRLRVCQRRRRPIGSFSTSGYTFSQTKTGPGRDRMPGNSRVRSPASSKACARG